MAGNAETIWEGIERYFAAGCTRVLLASAPRDRAHVLRLLEFVVYGTKPGPGSVSVQADVEASLEPDS